MSKVLNAGSNGGGPSSAVFFKHKKEFDALKGQKASLMTREKKLKKAAEEDGVLWDDLKAISKIYDGGAVASTEEAARINRMRVFLTYMKHPLGALLPVIDESKASDDTNMTDEEREAKWRGIGEVAGLAGKTLTDVTAGHDPNSEVGRWIIAGWEKGQATNAAGIKAPKGAKEPEKPADAKVQPKPEPEVAAAGAKKRAGAKTGTIFLHNPDLKKVLAIDVSQAQPEGYVPVTKPEFEKLEAEYAKAAADEWEESAPDPDADGDTAADDFDTPPDPS